ncbi:hypothetical protein K435DRAFT_621835, partial [Dendrothele bispora CBS 962.96]
LRTLACGEVRLRVPTRSPADGFFTLVLKECYHAPDLPMNLISVGALIDDGMTFKWSPDRATVYVPGPASSSFTTTVTNGLCFLDCDFLVPPCNAGMDASFSLAAAAAPAPMSASILHARCVHAGRPVMDRVLAGKLVNGVSWDGVPLPELCPSCIEGKRPAAPFASP